MHRIDNGTEILSEDGKQIFTDGDPNQADAQRASILDSSWLNAVQEELCTAIQWNGISLDKNRNDQLYSAIEKNVLFYVDKAKTELWEKMGFIDRKLESLETETRDFIRTANSRLEILEEELEKGKK